MNTSLLVFLAISALTAIIAIIINNKIIGKKNQVAQAYGSIEIYLKKRFDKKINRFYLELKLRDLLL